MFTVYFLDWLYIRFSLLVVILIGPELLSLFILPSETELGIFRRIINDELQFVSEPWPSISESAKELIKQMLVKDPMKRISAHEVLCEFLEYYF